MESYCIQQYYTLSEKKYDRSTHCYLKKDIADFLYAESEAENQIPSCSKFNNNYENSHRDGKVTVVNH
jgi:hypothetical protein